MPGRHDQWRPPLTGVNLGDLSIHRRDDEAGERADVKIEGGQLTHRRQDMGTVGDALAKYLDERPKRARLAHAQPPYEPPQHDEVAHRYAENLARWGVRAGTAINLARPQHPRERLEPPIEGRGLVCAL
jgi:hypothetical protein